MKLIIVESPGKIKTIQKFLGSDFLIAASNGHIMNLPDNALGVDPKKGFIPEYVVIPGRKKVIQDLKKAKESATEVLLAPDPDREGEAIASNLAQVLNIAPDSSCRIVFQEITESAVKKAIDNPRRIDQSKVEAQKSRRVLDRLAGYMISPVLWSKVAKGTSAGRVQSVALLLICEREQEVERFIPEKFHKIFAEYKGADYSFTSEVVLRDGKKFRIDDTAEACQIIEKLKAEPQPIDSVEIKSKKENPPDPFITSTLQQEGNQRFGFSAERTMRIAQKLYEGVDFGSEGSVALITYMRTDSVRISEEAKAVAVDYIKARFGSEYLGAGKYVRPKKDSKFTQDAHEAIRPTYLSRDPDSVAKFLSREELQLYNMIWQRFTASQMAPREFEEISLSQSSGIYGLESKCLRQTFLGFRAVYKSEASETQKNNFGSLTAGCKLTPSSVEREDKETQPPPRFTEATLIKALEKEGVGRPSTYALILKTIQDRKYVDKNERKFHPTDLGIIVNDVLKKFFKELIDIKFTARMEEKLDKIELGSETSEKMLDSFYQSLLSEIETAKKKLIKIRLKVSNPCPTCQGALEIIYGRNGRFIACSKYPLCKFTRPVPQHARLLKTTSSTEEDQLDVTEFLAAKENSLEVLGTCPECQGNLVQRTGRFGDFVACSNYPKCKYTRKDKTPIPCPVLDCSGNLSRRRGKKGRFFYGCSRYPDCSYTSFQKPELTLCPDCNQPMKLKDKTWICLNCGTPDKT
ncbi:MAG: type I DNA topoisomerase [Candidatus Wallbacteria bacterium]|nr:type I DNA topoisomerase [Candidatus Wallbacteria bacterium]